MFGALAAAGLAIFALSPPLAAQEPIRGDTVAASDSETGSPAVVRVGVRVRITLANRAAPAPLVGTVKYVDRDSLVVEREEGGIRTLAPRHVERLDVSLGKEREVGKSAGYGLLTVGPLLAIGAVLLVLSPGPEFTGPIATLLLAVAAGGILAGVVIGGTSPQDVWVEAEWPGVDAAAAIDPVAEDPDSIPAGDRQ